MSFTKILKGNSTTASKQTTNWLLKVWIGKKEKKEIKLSPNFGCQPQWLEQLSHKKKKMTYLYFPATQSTIFSFFLPNNGCIDGTDSLQTRWVTHPNWLGLGLSFFFLCSTELVVNAYEKATSHGNGSDRHECAPTGPQRKAASMWMKTITTRRIWNSLSFSCRPEEVEHVSLEFDFNKRLTGWIQE